MQVAPPRRKPLWQETLHQAILLTQSEIAPWFRHASDKVPDHSLFLDLMIPTLRTRYPSIRLAEVSALLTLPEQEQRVGSLPYVYEIDGQWFDQTGWVRDCTLKSRAVEFFKPSMEGGQEVVSFTVEPTEYWNVNEASPQVARKIKKILLGHLAQLEALALDVSTRGLPKRAVRRSRI